MNLEIKKNKKYLLNATIFLIIVFLIIMRRPDIISNAQPWAEDGRFWLQDAYNNGIFNTLFMPENGYFQTISRLTYSIALLFGLSKAALVANIIGILIRACFIAFILSSRIKFAPIAYRATVALYVLLMPNVAEGYPNITNMHWYLSMYLLCVIMSERPESTAWKIHDYVLLIVSGLSGPFVIFIAPCLLMKRVCQHGGIVNAVRKINSFDIVFTLCFLIQLYTILTSSGATRSSAPLGASIQLFSDITFYRIIRGALIDNTWKPGINGNQASIALNVIIITSILYYALKSGWRYKSILLFPSLMLGFALAKPMMSMTDPQWPLFLSPLGGERYFFVTNIAFFSFITFLTSKTKRPAIALLCLNILMATMYIRHFHIYPYFEVGYKEQIRLFENSPPGTEADISINPPGWKMHLIKK
ncbi:glucosyl transferase [Pantoea sp. ARC270]|uniref:glucosyl transferase n=2 Tax=unclassified Pantoea TaxID=2630326 RepID=UPI000DA9740B|nr:MULTISPECIES: glucosyl transferase [unclassified Pantoea]KAA6002035.1 glucosyl transferase [Pantoea sp. M_5]PZL86566.1 glucosyl transferase [Pantoea sp. ARC270]